jgi:DHA1 family bicyclomycin/chloramphenicol resistance-like MFS transporter
MDEITKGYPDLGRVTAFRRRGLLLSLTVSLSLGLVASTIYVPSIPAIASGLHTSIAPVQFTFVAYLVAFAASMLALGPLSDRFGRKRILICGLVLTAFSSVGCASAPTIEILIAARVLQGIGACAGMVIGRAATRDIWRPEVAAQVIAGRVIVSTLLQAFAPVLGGYLQTWFGWRANFVAVAVFSCLAIALIGCFLPGGDKGRRQRLERWPMLASYRALLRTRRFIGYSFSSTGAHAGFHIFAAGAPAALIGKFGLTPDQYGYYASLPPLGYILGSFASRCLTERLGIDRVITIGTMVLIPAAIAMVALALAEISHPLVVVGPMIFVCCASGLINSNAAVGSLGTNPRIVGAASGLGSFIQMTGAASATAALSLGPSGSPVTLALVVASAGLFCVISFGTLISSPPVSTELGAPV